MGQTSHALLYNVVSLSQVHAGITSFACRDISTHMKWIVHRMDSRGCRSHRKDHSSCLIEILTSRTRLPSGGSPLSPARTYVKCPQGSFLRLCIFVMQENRMSIHSIMRETHCRYRQIDPPASAFATQFRPATGVIDRKVILTCCLSELPQKTGTVTSFEY